MVQQLSTIVLSLSRELDHMSIVPDSYMEQTLNQSINQSIKPSMTCSWLGWRQSELHGVWLLVCADSTLILYLI